MDQYRVFGNPIKQSRSPFIHQAFAQQTKQILNYQSELVALDGFDQAIEHLINIGGFGANVTAPFKDQAYALCDELSERARTAEAVNTLTFKNNKIYGDNTDGVGLVQDLLRQKVKLNKARILLLGAGGAAKGVLLPLLEQEPDTITIANRTVSKAEQIGRQFKNDKLIACGFDELINQHFDVIINATSASLHGELPPVPKKVFEKTVCYDMVYSKQLTPFLVLANESGAIKTIDGLGMLVGQAAESFAVWRGVKPSVESVISSLRATINQS